MKAFFGWILMAIGGLIALTCGLCTLGVAGGGIVGAVQPYGGGLPTAGAAIAMALAFGGLPTAAGVAMAISGWRLARPKPSASVHEDRP